MQMQKIEILYNKIWICNSPPKCSIPVWDYIGSINLRNNLIIIKFNDREIIYDHNMQIEIGNFGTDIINKWIRIKYDKYNYIYICDGSFLGWKGLIWGTREIYKFFQNHH